MRALIVYCHPDPSSFNAAVLAVVERKLKQAGAELRIEDLYKAQFDPILSRQGLADYPDPSCNRGPVEAHVRNIEWCDTLIFVYPTWWYGLPALLKGWLDRAMLPGLAFHLPQGDRKAIQPGLTHINRLAVFTTCGATWLWTKFVGSPGKRTLLRGLRALCARRTRTAFRAHYSMDASTSETRARHLQCVESAMDRFLRGSAASSLSKERSAG